MLAAPTGKAAYNIKGVTLHRALFIAANQKMEYRQLTWDNLNIARNKFRGVEWLLIDEFSMLGKRMLKFIHLRLQEIRGSQLPFGGMNIVLFGDLHQLQPVKDGWIFENMDDAYGPLATNLFKDYFTLFELHEIMRQKDDIQFAEMLNRLRTASQSEDDISILKTRVMSSERSLELTSVPHYFTANVLKDAFNLEILNRSPGRTVTVCAIDVAPSDIPKQEQAKALHAAKTKDMNATGKLPYELLLKEGQLYEVTANIAVEDGILNGADCILRRIEETLGDKLPLCLWVQFLDPVAGQEKRKTVTHAYSKYTKQQWTPITPMKRTFVASKKNIKVTRLQFPLQLASARTIHKAQSATHEKVIIDMSGCDNAPRHFWDHMHYVAFSRSTTLNGLHIVDVNESRIRSSQKVKEYLTCDRRLMELNFTPTYKTNTTLKVYFNNICSIRRKWQAAKGNHNIASADVIFLAETWLSSNNQSQDFGLPHHEQFRSDSNIMESHRGILMYIHDTLEATGVTMHQSNDMEAVQGIVHKGHFKLQVIGLYKPPSASHAGFVDYLAGLLSSFDMHSPVLIVGDINIDMLDQAGGQFKKHMKDTYGLCQIIRQSTTFEGTLIDVAFTNVTQSTSDVIVNTWSGHHSLVVHVPIV